MTRRFAQTVAQVGPSASPDPEHVARGRLTNAQNRTAQGEILSGSTYGYGTLNFRIRVSSVRVRHRFRGRLLPMILPAVRERLLEPLHVGVGLDLHHPHVGPARSALADGSLRHAGCADSHVFGEFARQFVLVHDAGRAQVSEVGRELAGPISPMGTASASNSRNSFGSSSLCSPANEFGPRNSVNALTLGNSWYAELFRRTFSAPSDRVDRNASTDSLR